MFAGFDFDVIVRSLPYLFLEGMRFTITLTLLATFLGIVYGRHLSARRKRRLAVSPAS